LDKKVVYAHLSILAANLIYGANYSIAKDVMPNFILPNAFVFLRVCVAAFLFCITSLFVPQQTIQKQDYLLFVKCAFFGVACNQLLFFQGLSNTSPIHASIMMLCTPLLVIVFGFFSLKEKINSQKILGLILGFIGASFLILSKNMQSKNSATVYGDICILCNAASWGYYLLIVPQLMKKYNTVIVMRNLFLIGIVFVFPFGIQEISISSIATFPTHIQLGVLYVAVFTTFLAYLLNNIALKNVNPSVVSIYIYLQPVLASMFAIFLNKDVLDRTKIISALVIVLGILLVSKNKRLKPA
jgi:drug/metabolite transporter (DMT)-like permease